MKKILFLLIILAFNSYAEEFKVTQLDNGNSVLVKTSSSEIIVKKGERFNFNIPYGVSKDQIALAFSFNRALNFNNFIYNKRQVENALIKLSANWSANKLNESIIDACMFLSNNNCLNSYLQSKNENFITRSAMYLFALSNDWQEQYTILAKALKVAPNNKKLLFEAQRLSLSIALSYTESLLDEMQKNHIWVDLGMDSMIDGKLTYGEGFSEFFFNTFYSVSVAIVPGYYDSVVKEFIRQHNEVLLVKSKLYIALENHIESNGKYWITDDQNYTIKNKFNWGSFDEHPIFKIIKNNGLISLNESQDGIAGLPSYSTLGFKDREGFWARDFTRKGWRTSLVGEINVLNVLLFVYGPPAIMATASTKIGVKLITKLRLNRLITVAKSLPKPFDGLSIIVLMEFADGHAFKFIYSGYLAVRDMNTPPTPPKLDIK